MKRNLNVALTTLAGTAILVGASVDAFAAALNEFGATLDDNQRKQLKSVVEKYTGEPMTAKRVACDALLMQHQDEQNMAGTEKVRRFKLAQKIFEADGDIDITSEDVTLIKNAVTKSFTPLVVGQLYALLESELKQVGGQEAAG